MSDGENVLSEVQLPSKSINKSQHQQIKQALLHCVFQGGVIPELGLTNEKEIRDPDIIMK